MHTKGTYSKGQLPCQLNLHCEQFYKISNFFHANISPKTVAVPCGGSQKLVGSIAFELPWPVEKSFLWKLGHHIHYNIISSFSVSTETLFHIPSNTDKFDWTNEFIRKTVSFELKTYENSNAIKQSGDFNR